MPKEGFSKALEEYHTFREWNGDGRTTKKKLKDLGNEDKIIQAYLHTLDKFFKTKK